MSVKSRGFLFLKLIAAYLAMGVLANDFTVVTVIALVFVTIGGSVYLIGEALARDD